MSKRELIDEIRLFNPTATSSFLAEFGEADLEQYLQHLRSTMPPPLMCVRQPAPPPPAPDPRQLALAF